MDEWLNVHPDGRFNRTLCVIVSSAKMEAYAFAPDTDLAYSARASSYCVREARGRRAADCVGSLTVGRAAQRGVGMYPGAESQMRQVVSSLAEAMLSPSGLQAMSWTYC